MPISMRERQDEDCMGETVLNRVTEKGRLTSPQLDYPAITTKKEPSVGLSINDDHVPDLPKLAWLACLDQKIFTELSVFHGSSVECGKTWMVEGV